MHSVNFLDLTSPTQERCYICMDNCETARKHNCCSWISCENCWNAWYSKFEEFDDLCCMHCKTIFKHAEEYDGKEPEEIIRRLEQTLQFMRLHRMNSITPSHPECIIS